MQYIWFAIYAFHSIMTQFTGAYMLQLPRSLDATLYLDSDVYQHRKNASKIYTMAVLYIIMYTI